MMTLAPKCSVQPPAPRHLALDFVTALELSPSELVDQAVANDCDTISVLVQDSPLLPYFPTSTVGHDGAARRELRTKCDALGVSIDTAEVFLMLPDSDIASFERAIDSAAFLGANAINTLAFDLDPIRLADNYARLCELAAKYELNVTTEVHRAAAHSSIAAAVEFFRPLGLDVKVEVDALHFFRYGGLPEEVALHAGRIGRAQICDGPPSASDAEYQLEALFYRAMPGEGAFPLIPFVQSLPCDVVIGVEVPNSAYRTADRISTAVANTRRLIAAALV